MSEIIEQKCSYAELPSIRTEVSNLLNREEQEALIVKAGQTCFEKGDWNDGKYYCYYHLPYPVRSAGHPEPDSEAGLIIKEKERVFLQLAQEKHNNFTGYSFSPDFNFSLLNFAEIEPVDFRCAVFKGNSNFTDFEFRSDTYFSGAVFEGKVSFAKSVFRNKTHFKRTVFKRHTNFTKAEFHSFADFLKAKFYKKAEFDETKFGERDGIEFIDSEGNLQIENITSNFHESEFRGALNFSASRFKGIANFTSVKFLKSVTFESSGFEDLAIFVNCIFKEEASFKKTAFGKAGEPKKIVSFSGSDFFGEAFFSSKDSLYSSWENAFFTFDRVSFKNIAQTRFVSVPLNSSGFIRTDPRKIEFTNVKWGNAEKSNKERIIQEITLISQPENKSILVNEIKVDVSDNERSILRMLSHTCRRLAVNSEEDHRYKSASIFRTIAFECERLERRIKFANWISRLDLESEKLKRRFGGSAAEEDIARAPVNSFSVLYRNGDFIVDKLYRLTSLYGENWGRAAMVLLLLILGIFPFIYTRTDFQVSSKMLPLSMVLTGCKDVKDIKPEDCQIKREGLGFWNGESINQSLTSATLQSVEYRRPMTGWGEFWIILEKILAPLQTALLALSIRRKFMR